LRIRIRIKSMRIRKPAFKVELHLIVVLTDPVCSLIRAVHQLEIFRNEAKESALARAVIQIRNRIRGSMPLTNDSVHVHH
jgi:hypothetical protein